MAEEPATSEAGDGGEGRRGEAHHHVRHRHVTHQQVHPRVQRGGPGQREGYGCSTKTHYPFCVINFKQKKLLKLMLNLLSISLNVYIT